MLGVHVTVSAVRFCWVNVCKTEPLGRRLDVCYVELKNQVREAAAGMLDVQ